MLGVKGESINCLEKEVYEMVMVCSRCVLNMWLNIR